MWVTQKQLENLENRFAKTIQFSDDRYWKLYHRHQNLLTYLGLYEQVLPEMTVLKSKQGPEPGLGMEKERG